MLDEVTKELQFEESTEEANSMEEVHGIDKKFQESPNNWWNAAKQRCILPVRLKTRTKRSLCKSLLL